MAEYETAPVEKVYRSLNLGFDASFRDDDGKRVPAFFVNGELRTSYCKVQQANRM